VNNNSPSDRVEQQAGIKHSRTVHRELAGATTIHAIPKNQQAKGS